MGQRRGRQVLLTSPLTSDVSLGLSVFLWFSETWRHQRLSELLSQDGGTEVTCTRAADQVKLLSWRWQKHPPWGARTLTSCSAELLPVKPDPDPVLAQN